MDGDLAPYFQTLWNRDENTPLPTTDPGLQTIISSRLQTAYDILLGHARPMHKSGWNEHKKKHQIECEEWTGAVAPDRPPPPRLSDTTAFPPVEAAASKTAAVRGKVAPFPKKASSSTVSQSYAAEIPVSTLTDSPMVPSTTPQSSDLPLASPMPAAAPAPRLLVSPAPSSSPVPAPLTVQFTGGTALPQDELMPPATVTTAHLEQAGTPFDKGVKLTSHPIIHPPAQPGPSGSNRAPSPPSNLCRSFLTPPLHPFLYGWLL